MYDLVRLGFGPFFEEQLQLLRDSGSAATFPARIAAEHRGGYEIWSVLGVGFAAASGRLRHREELPAVGDWVTIDGDTGPGHTAIINHVLPRRTVFTRGSAGRAARPQVVAANVDQVFIVCGLDSDFSLHRIERYLARVWASGATPAVVLNKMDLCADVAGCVREVERHCPAVPVFLTQASTSDGAAALAATIAVGTTTAFVGSSGAGKSTLINALLGDARLPTAPTRESDGQGCHTTTHRQLVSLPQGGLVLDTPGMRELQILDEDGLDQVFDDIEVLAADCRFRDCRHDHESGCAVKEAARNGALDPGRLDHYQQLLREARAYERRHDAHLRHQSERVWGQLHAEAARLRKWKEGG